MQISKFDKLAQAWDSHPTRVKGAMAFVSKIKEYLAKDLQSKILLDYGCGTGLVSFGFAQDVKSILGLDNSSNMVDIYNDKSTKIGLSNITAKLHDINTQALDINQFDIVATNMTMHHIKDTNNFISTLYNSLKEDGFLCIADLKIEDGTFHSDNTEVEHFGFDINKIKRYFKNANLKNIKVGLLEKIVKPNNSYEVFYAIGQKI
ncbi:S-adenosylmethionine-dependent methyltransferase [hydrothermal vent metagenome]|uniref:S-adenosylmethionine-dependent methyltransferase n=1 Tax=hydrothermal vent metagenome TaxID=652676 RepID=A0A3B1E523_9ZZZZ